MNFLLKIVEGPMKGAEIALVQGLRVKVGSGADGDIVLADSALAPLAFELDVSEASVALVTATETRTLNLFEIFRFGDSGFAIGPADEPWDKLQDAAKAKAGEEKPAAGGEAPVPKPAAAAEPETAADKDDGDKRGGFGCGCLTLILLVVLLGAVAGWVFWDRIAEKYPQADNYRQMLIDYARQWQAQDGEAEVRAEPAKKVPTLEEIAKDYHLEYIPAANPASRPLLAGNVERRTERLAIRALALASDPSVRFDLTDDETLRNAADELLFVVTEGSLKAVAASNRTVTIRGYSPSAAKLEETLRALNADVKGIERLDTSAIQVGGIPPAAPDAPAEEVAAAKAPRSRGTKTSVARDYPIAGILTVPYPCVVMRNGLRLAEGAQLGNATIVRIEADKLVLKSGKNTFDWKP